jgi:uncharacterized protein (TIRG00374 family)
VKWRHAAEALLTGFAANYILPARVGELFRADYARRVFNMSRFTSLGTIVVERAFDGILLACMLWSSFAWVFFTRLISVETSWILLLGAVASVLFSGALIFVLTAHQIDLRRFGVPQSVATRWDRLVKGISSVLRGNSTTVVLYTIGVWTLEVVALAGMVRSFGVSLAPPELLMLLSLASLSTLLPTAPAYVGTYQLVFGYVFRMFGYQQTIGIVAATAVQIFSFGTVTIIGGLVQQSRGGIMLWRTNRWLPPRDRIESRGPCRD